ncbi:hypothetical protein ACFFOM_15510 [Microlunatus capsulatus]|uniref:Uncharacterized protein n=1 Tax=Microlunatus capsulatus TaxID=99117 RepID=A0ABS4Z720_9ACTN|nr:hypothetical protein [Microlunatus capsulatus]MBP2416844.1 hypothetical protein [Microlunatus capsulatus]
MTDWDWFFTSEAGRTNLLRSQVDDLAASSASANARSSRLSSQLAQLQGSLETRLNALSQAFDAYVELGDVREQLAAHAGTAAVRRDVLAAVEALVAGRPAERVEPGPEDDYWLPHAMNAVTALVAGAPDRAAEERAAALDRQADLFVVVLLGALGRGALVADRVPDLLVTDGSLGPEQVALWHALLAGVHNDPGGGPDLLAAVGERWAPTLAGGDAAEWRDWVAEQSGAADADAELAWVRALLDGQVLLPLVAPAPRRREVSRRRAAEEPVAPPAADEDPRAVLRATAGAMIAEGSEPERDLLVRARLLRQRIEDPGGLPPTAPAEPVRTGVRDLVREAFAGTRDPALRARLLGWLHPGLRQAVEAAAASPLPAVEPVEQRTPGGPLVVGPDGPDPARLAQVRHNISARPHDGTWSPVVPGVLAGAAGLLALVGALLGWPLGLVLLVLAVGVVLGLLALGAARSRRAAATEQAGDLATVDRVVAEARQRLADARAEQQRRASGRTVLLEGLRRDLAAGGLSA